MRFGRQLKSAVAASCLLVGSTTGWTQTVPLRIGVLNDQGGNFMESSGPGSVVAAKMAAEDFGGKILGREIEIVVGDHQNKADIGAAIVRKWFDVDGVDMVIDVPNSSVAFAVNNIVRDKDKVFIASAAGTASLTGADCSPNFVHWTYDTFAYGQAMGRTVTEKFGKKWFFMTADYAFGRDLETQTTAAVKATGGTVVGSVRFPLGTFDFSSFVLQAQNSGADVIAIASGGADTTNSIKQASEFGLQKDAKIVGVMGMVDNLWSLGPVAADGAYIVAPFYWDLDDDTRSFSKRFQSRMTTGAVPTDHQAGVYAGVLHYLKAVQKVGESSDGKAVVAAMKSIPTDDPLFKKGMIRADGRKIHDLYLLQAKGPADSTSKYDLAKIVEKIPGDSAFRPLADGKCPLVN
jgi:branched-chain amino acid transport system substrate-binding protein